MTQVQTMTNQELNRKLAVLMGYTEDKRYPGRVIKGTAVTMPKDYCNDPAASLEIQAKAIEVDASEYVNYLSMARQKICYENYSALGVSYLLNATTRERAEAAYITLQEALGHVD